MESYFGLNPPQNKKVIAKGKSEVALACKIFFENIEIRQKIWDHLRRLMWHSGEHLHGSGSCKYGWNLPVKSSRTPERKNLVASGNANGLVETYLERRAQTCGSPEHGWVRSTLRKCNHVSMGHCSLQGKIQIFPVRRHLQGPAIAIWSRIGR